MGPNLTTTNILLGIMAAVSVLQVLAVVGVFVGAYLIFRRVMQVLRAIEERQVAPTITRVNAILDDVKGMTSTVKEGTGHVESALKRLLSYIPGVTSRLVI